MTILLNMVSTPPVSYPIIATSHSDLNSVVPLRDSSPTFWVLWSLWLVSFKMAAPRCSEVSIQLFKPFSSSHKDTLNIVNAKIKLMLRVFKHLNIIGALKGNNFANHPIVVVVTMHWRWVELSAEVFRCESCGMAISNKSLNTFAKTLFIEFTETSITWKVNCFINKRFFFNMNYF